MSLKKSHGIELLIRAVVKDKDGKVISDTGLKPSRSFVIQFLEFFYFQFRGTDGNATATGGTEDPIYDDYMYSHRNLNVDAPVNNDLYGIVVGTGNTAVTNTDFVLDVQLTEGVGAGNITHNESVVDTPVVVGANVDLDLTRSFTNQTGVLITVREAGIYAKHRYAAPLYYHMIVRDVLVSEVDVPDTCSLTIYYIVRTTV